MRQWGRPPSANGPTGRRMKRWCGGAARRASLLVVLRDLGQLAERVGVADGEVGEHLPVDLDSALPEAGDQPAVAQAVDPGRRVDPGDPERAELGLLLPAVAVRVPHAALHGLLGGLVQLAPAAPGTLGGLHDLLFPGVVRDTTLHSGHGSLLTPGGDG